MNQYIHCSPAVQAALNAKAPVLALESTIISHGMPYPQNVETALACEKEARAHGAEPATIAVLGGKLCAGLTEAQIDSLGRAGTNVRKASRRDLPMLAAQRMDGATTVAATMIIASMAGIDVFATGGIGGVHRGAEKTLDISADLDEMGKTPVAVVCAGPKSILDIGLTLEYLETRGVPVIGYKTDELPAFYTRHSGFSVDMRMDTPQAIAAMLAAQRSLSYPGGALIANPVPKAYSMDKQVIDGVIEKALVQAKAEGVRGKEVTPFLLARIKDLTEGESLASNIQLVLNNVRLGAQISKALADR